MKIKNIVCIKNLIQTILRNKINYHVDRYYSQTWSNYIETQKHICIWTIPYQYYTNKTDPKNNNILKSSSSESK